VFGPPKEAIGELWQFLMKIGLGLRNFLEGSGLVKNVWPKRNPRFFQPFLKEGKEFGP